MDEFKISLTIYRFSDETRIAATTWHRAQEIHAAGHRNVADYYVAPGRFLSLEGNAEHAESLTFYPRDVVPR